MKKSLIHIRQSASSGFTIIEVTLVLAVAALIIAMVFLAVGALQRSQRTHAMEEAASRVLAADQNYAQDSGNNPTPYGPDLNSGTGKQYLDNAKVPAGINARQRNSGSDFANQNEIVYSAYATCGTNGKLADGAAAQYAVSYWSETAGGPVCKQSG